MATVSKRTAVDILDYVYAVLFLHLQAVRLIQVLLSARIERNQNFLQNFYLVFNVKLSIYAIL